MFGFPGFDGKKLILNARAETAAVKPTFAEAFRQRRAILPADGFSGPGELDLLLDMAARYLRRDKEED